MGKSTLKIDGRRAVKKVLDWNETLDKVEEDLKLMKRNKCQGRTLD